MFTTQALTEAYLPPCPQCAQDAATRAQRSNMLVPLAEAAAKSARFAVMVASSGLLSQLPQSALELAGAGGDGCDQQVWEGWFVIACSLVSLPLEASACSGGDAA